MSATLRTGGDSKLLTADEVASMLRVPKSWVYRACRSGAIPAVRCGRYVRFDPADIERWIDEQKGAVDPF
jgi:excisionase family DNA binding protein